MTERADSAQSSARFDYDVKIVRRQFDQTNDDWHATVTRRSDGKQLVYIATWLWMLKRKTSRGPLVRAFNRADARDRDGRRVEEFRV